MICQVAGYTHSSWLQECHDRYLWTWNVSFCYLFGYGSGNLIILYELIWNRSTEITFTQACQFMHTFILVHTCKNRDIFCLFIPCFVQILLPVTPVCCSREMSMVCSEDQFCLKASQLWFLSSVLHLPSLAVSASNTKVFLSANSWTYDR